MALKDQLAAQKSESCYDTDQAGHSFIEFQLTPETHQGFALAQLCHYSLEPNPAADDDAPERLTLGFSTADVVILGGRLLRLADHIRDHKLAAVRTLSGRYSNLQPSEPFVAKIVIRPLDKPGGAPG